jgi:hypothetical protein
MMVPPLPTWKAVLDWPYAAVPRIQLYLAKGYLRTEMKANIFPTYCTPTRSAWSLHTAFFLPGCFDIASSWAFHTRGDNVQAERSNAANLSQP